MLKGARADICRKSKIKRPSAKGLKFDYHFDPQKKVRINGNYFCPNQKRLSRFNFGSMNQAANFQIRIEQARTSIHTNDGEFSIEFIAMGKGRGRVRKERVRLGMPVSKRLDAKSQGLDILDPAKKSWNHNINKSHNMLLFDIEKGRPFEIKIWSLMQYNNINIIWHGPKK